MTCAETWPAKVGQNLKKLISESKFRTQVNFADVMGCDDSTVRRWISHGIDSLTTLGQIANVLEIDWKELLK